jgi:hypothetical protein
MVKYRDDNYFCNSYPQQQRLSGFIFQNSHSLYMMTNVNISYLYVYQNINIHGQLNNMYRP